jgi:hypothetical protein
LERAARHALGRIAFNKEGAGMGRASSFVSVTALALLAGCASRPAPAPAPQPAAPPPRVIVTPVMPTVPPPAAADWRDLDLTAGEWSYDGAAARFLAADGAAFALRCDAAARRILVEREGAAGEMTIRTTAGDRRFAEPRAPLSSSDPFLDAIAFSRGRFTVETAGRTLVIPAWPEPAKAVEDCRI